MAGMHLVAHVGNGWGHNKPLLAFFARIYELQPNTPFIITVLSSSPVMPKIERELRLLPRIVSDKLNVIDVGEPVTPYGPNLNVVSALDALREGRALTCQTTKKEHILPPPTVVLLDVLVTPPASAVKAAAGEACPVIAWLPSPMSANLTLFGPESLGGHGDIDQKLADAAQAQGKTIPEVADSVFKRTAGAIVKAPGAPDMYEEEYSPQEIMGNVSAALFLQGAYRSLLAVDGMVVVSTSAFERESIEIGRKWFAEDGKDTWVVGPLEDVPPAATANKAGAEIPQHAAEDAKILGFLDDMAQKHGARSVIYVSFGTNFYPSNDPSKLHAFIDELLRSDTPFLWSHASPFAQVPDDVAARIDASAHGFHASWVPQRAVLKHAATGWFVSHGGWNSLQETISLRVPTIIWPFGGDQPGNAALLSITHGAAFELLSVRMGTGARQPLRMEGKDVVDFSVEGVRRETRELLRKIKGEEGARVRANAERLGAEIDKSWKVGGEARGELDRFLQRFAA